MVNQSNLCNKYFAREIINPSNKKMLELKYLEACKSFILNHIDFNQVDNLKNLLNLLKQFDCSELDIMNILIELKNNKLWQQLEIDCANELAIFIVKLRNLCDLGALELINDNLVKFTKMVARKSSYSL